MHFLCMQYRKPSQVLSLKEQSHLRTGQTDNIVVLGVAVSTEYHIGSLKYMI